MSLGPKSLAHFSAFPSPVEKHICSWSGHSQRALTSSRKEALKKQLPLPPSPNSHSQKVRLKDFGGACSWTFCTDSRTTSACVTQCGICLQGIWTHTHLCLLVHWYMGHFSLFWSLPEYPVLWHALVMRTPHYGMDQCFCHAYDTAAAIQILRFATQISCSSRQVAEAWTWVLQQCSTAHVSRPEGKTI